LKKINVPFEMPDLGTKFLTSDIWFVCQDKKYKKVLRPQRYTKIYRGEYLKELEKEIREHFPYHEKDTSFLRASIFNATNSSRPDQILQREDYTYYFKLLPSELEKCLFAITIGGETVFSKGIQGFVSTYKVWVEDETEEEEGFVDRPRKDIQVFIPFKVKPQYYIPEVSKRIFYHGSKDRFSILNKYSYVTPYKEDAIKFAIPWSSEELLIKDEDMLKVGRPPRFLRFKRNVNIEDSKIYLYSVKGIETISASSNSGKSYPWNRITLKDAEEDCKSLKLERKIMSWKAELYG
jgi:hypothetical protein